MHLIPRSLHNSLRAPPEESVFDPLTKLSCAKISLPSLHTWKTRPNKGFCAMQRRARLVAWHSGVRERRARLYWIPSRRNCLRPFLRALPAALLEQKATRCQPVCTSICCKRALRTSLSLLLFPDAKTLAADLIKDKTLACIILITPSTINKPTPRSVAAGGVG